MWHSRLCVRERVRWPQACGNWNLERPRRAAPHAVNEVRECKEIRCMACMTLDPANTRQSTRQSRAQHAERRVGHVINTHMGARASCANSHTITTLRRVSMPWKMRARAPATPCTGTYILGKGCHGMSFILYRKKCGFKEADVHESVVQLHTRVCPQTKENLSLTPLPLHCITLPCLSCTELPQQDCTQTARSRLRRLLSEGE
jgi:hypothetical protein